MKDISISSTTIFSYNLGCGDGLGVEFEVTNKNPDGEWVRVQKNDGDKFTVEIDEYNGDGTRTADVKIRIGTTVCPNSIKVEQNGGGGGGGDDCPTHEVSGNTQEEVISLTLQISDNYSNIGCDGGSVTATPIVTYKEYKMVTTYDCNDVQQGQPRKVYVSNEKTKNLNQLNHTFDAIDCTQIPVGETRTNEHTFNASYGGKTTALTVTQTCQSCEEPEEHNPFFEVNFIQLNGGSWYYNELRTLGAPFVVSSSTWNGSSYQWTDVTITIDDTDYAQYITFDNGTPIAGNNTAKTFRMKFKDNMPNVTKNGIHVTVKQNGTDLSSGATFNVLHLDDILYNEIRPYILECTYMKGENVGGSNYYLHFKSESGVSINKKITFFANSDNYFSTNVDGGNCGGESQQQPQGLGNGPYMNAGEKNTYNCQQAPNSDCISIASERGLFLRFASQECKQQSGFYNNFYLYNDSSGLGTKIDFKNESGDKFLGCKDGPCPIESNSYYDGERSVYLKIPNQNEIEFVEGPHILKTSNVIFNAPNGRTTLSVYEDGAVFVDEAPEGVVTVNERFQDITQFVQQVYPNDSYTSIEACGLFNGVDLGEHCINDIVIEDGELIRRDESIPSPTRAMHIEQDEENN